MLRPGRMGSYPRADEWGRPVRSQGNKYTHMRVLSITSKAPSFPVYAAIVGLALGVATAAGGCFLSAGVS